jgi:HNH endonuclease
MRRLDAAGRLAAVEARILRGPGCWNWTGARDGSGYPLVSWRAGGRVTMHASRFIWESANGPIPAGLNVLHSCDNPACVRLDHLRLGTQADNCRESAIKGRHRGTLGHRWSYVLVEGKRKKRGG